MQISPQHIEHLWNLRESVNILEFEKEFSQIERIFCSLNQVAKVALPLLKALETIFFHYQPITSFFYRIVGYCVVIKTISFTSIHVKWKSINLIAHLYAKQLECLQKIRAHPLIPAYYIYLDASLVMTQTTIQLGDQDFNRANLFDKAKNMYLSLLDQGSESAETYLNLGYLLDVSGGNLQIKNKSMSVQDCYIKAIDLDPNMTAAYYNLASIISKKKITLLNGSSMTKKELYLKVISLGPTPNENEVYFCLANLLDKNEALIVLNEDQKLAFSEKNKEITILDRNREFILYDKNNAPLLLHENGIITFLDKDNFFTLVGKNGALKPLDKPSITKKELFIKAIALDPDMPLAYYELGLLLDENEEVTFLDGSSVTKKELFMKAIALDPNMPFASIIEQYLS
ncbi:hypothetical protein [Rhabdochlamydiaceae symbiont of Dictyostelium giganteum]|uniref:hypothetical protein n=1 Tax=Rhabdochlamydiaceae symbiont of Dictyostelium giganteum TaxID=3342349 RepID=UPI00384CDD06